MTAYKFKTFLEGLDTPKTQGSEDNVDLSSFLDTYINALSNPFQISQQRKKSKKKTEDSVTFQEDDASTETCDTEVPGFMGFYETPIKSYWDNRIEVAKLWCDTINEAIHEYYPSLNYTFKELYSPHQYNYSTDIVEAKATFDKNEIVNYLKNHLDELQSYAHEHRLLGEPYGNPKQFIANMENATGNDLDPYLQTAVMFVLQDEMNEIEDSFCSGVYEQVEEDTIAIIKERLEGGEEVYWTGNGISFEFADALQNYDEKDAQADLEKAQKAAPEHNWEIFYIPESHIEDYDPADYDY